MGTLANNEDPAFQSLHCLLRLKQPSGTEIHHIIGPSSCEPLTCTMESTIFIVLYDFLGTVKAAPHVCVIRTGQPKT